jgi:magnesium transporter
MMDAPNLDAPPLGPGSDGLELAVNAVRERLAVDDHESLRAYLTVHHEVDVAHLLEALHPPEATVALGLLPIEMRAEVFAHVGAASQRELATVMAQPDLVDLVHAMAHDDRADFFNRLDPEQQETLLPALSRAEREDLRRLASYEEGTAGAIMTSDYAALTPTSTARQAMDELWKQAPGRETIYYAYVLDAQRRILGVVSLRDLILARPSTPVEEVMERNVISGHVRDPHEQVAQMIAHYDLLALPIVNDEGVLVGIVTHDDAMDVREAEATEDFHRVATVGKLDVSLREAGFGLLYRKRIVWLVVLVFGNLFSGAGIAYFEDTIAQYVALVFFLPLLIDSGGNAGSQAATVMVRALATGDVELRDWGRMLGKEVLVAGALGATMALAVSGVGWVRGGPAIAVVVSLTMVAVVLVGSVAGALMPFLLSRLKLDPATASAPLITSIADVSGVLMYFAIASTLLPRLLA